MEEMVALRLLISVSFANTLEGVFQRIAAVEDHEIGHI